MNNWEPMEKDRILFSILGHVLEATVTQVERTETSTYIKLGIMGWMDRDDIKLIKLLT